MQLLGQGGLNGQFEASRDKVMEIRKARERLKQIYALDYQKIQIAVEKIKNDKFKKHKFNQSTQKINEDTVDRQNTLMAEKRKCEEEVTEYAEKLQDLQDKDQVVNIKLAEAQSKIAKLKAELLEYDIQRQGQQPKSPNQNKKDKKKKKKEAKKQAKSKIETSMEQAYNPIDQYETKSPTKLFSDDPPNVDQDFEFSKNNQSQSMMFMNETGKSMVFNDTMNSDQTQINLNQSSVSKQSQSVREKPSHLA